MIVTAGLTSQPEVGKLDGQQSTCENAREPSNEPVSGIDMVSWERIEDDGHSCHDEDDCIDSSVSN